MIISVVVGAMPAAILAGLQNCPDRMQRAPMRDDNAMIHRGHVRPLLFAAMITRSGSNPNFF
jgi:hypothetical protein